MTEWLLVLASVGLVAACGGFVAAEFALVTVDRASIERTAEAGDAKSAGVLAALRSLSTQLSGAQLGITVTNLAIGFLAEPAIARLIDGPLEAAGVPSGAVWGVSVTLALVVATAVTMIYGELVPKNLAIAKPVATARAVQGFQRGFTRAMAYPIRFLNGTANRIVRRIGVEPTEQLASARSPQELMSLVGRSAQQGTLAAETATLLQRSLAFGDKRAADVLTPRVRVRALHATDPVQAVLDAARDSGYSRFPVVGRDLDDIVGMVHLKHAVAVPEDDRDRVTVGQVMVAPVLVPSTLQLDSLLETLRGGGLQMAVVVDEFGGTDGVVTIEDLIEELVGDVRDEHDRPAGHARRLRSGAWSLSGLLRPDEVTTITGVPLPDGEGYETLGGLLGQRLGRVPARGDTVEVDGHRLLVERMDGRRVDRVILDPAALDLPPEPSDQQPTDRPASTPGATAIREPNR